MTYWDCANSEGKEVLKYTIANSPTEMIYLRKIISLYAEAFCYAKPCEEADQVVARMGLVSQNLNTLMLSLDAASRGYYIQCISLLKNVYENWLAFWYLAKYPGEAHRWLNPQYDLPRPGAERMRNRIDHPTMATKAKLLGFYQELNRFAHTNPVAILDRYRVVDEMPGIKVGVEYDSGNFSACCYALSLWNGAMLDAISCWIDDNHEWHSRYENIMREITDYLEKNNPEDKGNSAQPA